LYDFDFIFYLDFNLYLLTFDLNLNSSITKTKNKRSSKMAAGKFVKGIAVMSAAVALCVTFGCDNPIDDNGGGGGSGKGNDIANYKTVTIGNQTWMAENLDYKTGNSWCFKDSSSYCRKYGRLYDWETAMRACPSGWHLSSSEEWAELVEYVGGASVAGKKLKSKSGWYGNNGTDDYGFSALPGGRRFRDICDFGCYGFWWKAAEEDVMFGRPNYYGSITMHYSDERINMTEYSDKDEGYSVRCVQD
jgi:uncharacterized protein (TIGR02145 family)